MIIVAVLILWEALWRTGMVSALFFPGPSHIARALGHLAREGELTRSVTATGRRVVLGVDARTGAVVGGRCR